MLRRMFTVLLFGSLCFAFSACEDSGSKDEPSVNACQQDRDCGATPDVAKWKCHEQKCYLKKSFCLDADDCGENPCVNFQCQGVTDGDEEAEAEVNTDGDKDKEEEVVPCNYSCCEDRHCRANYLCEWETHTCVYNGPCDYACCLNRHCQDNPEFGSEYICRMNECVKPGDPCTHECCSNEACQESKGPGWLCLRGTCYESQVSCTEGQSKCCTSDSNNEACNALGELKVESKLVCNDQGNGWILSVCDSKFHTCIDNGNGTVDCTYNYRCEVADDCACPYACNDTDSGKRCTLPVVAADELCKSDTCTAGVFDYIASCPEGTVCCTGIKPAEPDKGYCTLEANCTK